MRRCRSKLGNGATSRARRKKREKRAQGVDILGHAGPAVPPFLQHWLNGVHVGDFEQVAWHRGVPSSVDFSASLGCTPPLSPPAFFTYRTELGSSAAPLGRRADHFLDPIARCC